MTFSGTHMLTVRTGSYGPATSCILFRNLLVWLDSFDQKWNSHYDRNGLAGQFWQMKSLRTSRMFAFRLCPRKSVKAQFIYLSYILSFEIALKLGLLPDGITFIKKNNKRTWSQVRWNMKDFLRKYFPRHLMVYISHAMTMKVHWYTVLISFLSSGNKDSGALFIFIVDRPSSTQSSRVSRSATRQSRGLQERLS